VDFRAHLPATLDVRAQLSHPDLEGRRVLTLCSK
jgi:hypothetical protein